MINDRGVQVEKKNRNVTAECTGYPYSLCPPTKRTVTGPNPGHLNGRYHTAA